MRGAALTMYRSVRPWLTLALVPFVLGVSCTDPIPPTIWGRSQAPGVRPVRAVPAVFRAAPAAPAAARAAPAAARAAPAAVRVVRAELQAGSTAPRTGPPARLT